MNGRVAVVAVAATCLAPSVHANQPEYRFTQFDHPLAHALTYVIGINNHGDVSGDYDDENGAFHGWARLGHQLVAIDHPGAVSTFVGAINEHREVVGTYIDAGGVQHGFVWHEGRFTDLDVPGAGITAAAGPATELGPGLGTAAFRPNDHGDVVGEYADPTGFVHGFLRREHHGFEPIDFPGASQVPGFGTQLIALNEHGDLGGSYEVDGSPLVHGFIRVHGRFESLDHPDVGGSFGTQVNGCNDKDVFVGPYSDANDTLHGFIYHDGTFTTVDFPGAPFSEIDSINDHGDIVGEWYDLNGVAHGYVGTRR
jgi:probable HAF family extracellular repeat protein